MSNVLNWYIKSGKTAPDDAIFIVQDVTDADNYTAVVDILTHVEHEQVFFVLVGRYADFSLPNAPFQYPNYKQLNEDIPGEDEKQSRIDSIEAQKDGMRRMITVLRKLDLYIKITAFIRDEAFVTSKKPVLAHTNHVLDFLFDRKDLVTSKGSIGDILTPDEYLKLLSMYNNIEGQPLVGENRTIVRSSERQQMIRDLIGDGLQKWTPPDNIHSFKEAHALYMSQSFNNVTVFLLAPLTGATMLLQSIRTNTTITVYGQLFAWNNLDEKSQNIFLNQFNVDCDQDSTIQFLEEVALNPKRYNVILCPTEVTKLSEDHGKIEKELLCPVAQKPKESDPLLLQIYAVYCQAKRSNQKVCGTDTYAPEPQYDIDATRLFKSLDEEIQMHPVNISWIPLHNYTEIDKTRASDAYLQLDKNGHAQRKGFKMVKTSNKSNIRALEPSTTMSQDWKNRLYYALQYNIEN